MQPNSRLLPSRTSPYCPVPNKSARCQSIRPVRVSLPAIRSESIRRWPRSARPLPPPRSVPACRRYEDLSARPRHGHAIGLGQVAQILSNTVLGRLQTTIGTLIVCHSIRPAQVSATLAGRLIWHRTLTDPPRSECSHARRRRSVCRWLLGFRRQRRSDRTDLHRRLQGRRSSASCR